MAESGSFPSTADIVIIGGGALGASVALHLAWNGWRRVVVLDAQPEPGLGSTGRATGGFRSTFATATNVQLSLRSRELFRGWSDRIGGDCGYRPVGYLWIAYTEAVLESLRQALAVQHAAGLTESELVGPDEVLRLNPAVSPRQVRGALWCPTDGYITPLEVLSGYVDAARRAGVTFLYGTAARGLRLDGDRVEEVRTDRGEIQSGTVVIAAGAWSGPLAEMAGVDVPVKPVRRQVAMTVPTTVLTPDVPMTIWAEDGFHLRWREGRVLYAWPTPGDPADPWSTAVEPQWVEETKAMAAERVPVLRDVPVDPARCWAGLYELTPDKLALLGPSTAVENLFLVTGASGHGVMHSPALGEAAAAMLSCDVPPVPVTELRPERFTDPAAWAEREGL